MGKINTCFVNSTINKQPIPKKKYKIWISKQNWIEIYTFHVFCVTFVTIKLNSLFQYFSSFNTSCSCSKTFAIFPWNVWEHSPAFPGIFGNITLYIGGHSPECLTTFPEIFSNIPLNIWGHSQEFLEAFPRIFEDISRNVWQHSPECSRTFLEMFADIPQNGLRLEWNGCVFVYLKCESIGYWYIVVICQNQLIILKMHVVQPLQIVPV